MFYLRLFFIFFTFLQARTLKNFNTSFLLKTVFNGHSVALFLSSFFLRRPRLNTNFFTIFRRPCLRSRNTRCRTRRPSIGSASFWQRTPVGRRTSPSTPCTRERATPTSYPPLLQWMAAPTLVRIHAINRRVQREFSFLFIYELENGKKALVEICLWEIPTRSCILACLWIQCFGSG